MIPIILVSNSKTLTAAYLKKISDKKSVIISVQSQKTEYSIEQIREIQKETKVFYPQKRIYLLENFQNSSLEAQNAFLKLLEEPPKNIQFILTIDSTYKLLPTIFSRSKIINLIKEEKIIIEEKLVKILQSVTQYPSPILSLSVEVKKKEEARNVLYQMLYFFRQRLKNDIIASSVLKEVLKKLTLLENNNLHPQLVIDYLLIFIYKCYNRYNGYKDYKKV